MSETLRLLKYDPAVALLIMANNQLNTNLLPQYSSVSAPTSISGSLTSVEISTHETVDEYIYRRHTGSMVYRYNRIDVADVFGGMILDLTPPLTIYGVMENLAAASGLVFTDDDFENALVLANSFVLKAKPESLRWVGETTVVLNEPREVIRFADAFPNNILNGFVAPPLGGDIDLALYLPETKLEGLNYVKK